MSLSLCGYELQNPFMLASGPPTANGFMIARAFELGWAGAVTKTIFLDAERTLSPSPCLQVMSMNGRGGALVYGLHNIEMGSTRPIALWENDILDLSRKIIIARQQLGMIL